MKLFDPTLKLDVVQIFLQRDVIQWGTIFMYMQAYISGEFLLKMNAIFLLSISRAPLPKFK